MDAANQQQQQQQETRRTSKGRQKIEIKRVEKESNRYVTFSKRKNGLFKKATELSTSLCGAETAVIIFSEHRKLFSCGQPDVDQVLDRYLAETERVPNNFPSLIKNNVENQLANKQEYAESLKRLEEEQTVAKMIGSMNNMNGGGFWWDLPIDNMEQDELEAYRESMEELKKNLIARLGLIESTPAFQRFAVRSSRRIDDISNMAAKKKQELAEQVSKNFEPHQKESRKRRRKNEAETSSKYFQWQLLLYQEKQTTCATPTRCLNSRYLSHCTAASSNPPLPLPRSVLPLVGGIQSLPQITQRFLFSTSIPTTTPTVVDSEISKNTEEAKSNGDEKSGDSKHQDDKNNARRTVRRGPISWLSFLFLAATGAGLIWYYDRMKKQRIEAINKSSAIVKVGPSAGKPEIGGPFNLIDHDGKPVTEKDFMGKWTMIYFGFTHCPDICPDELQKLAAAIDKIKEKAGFDIVPVFITVDPERDNVEQVREYVKEFHPKLIGLTGSLEEIKRTARSYRIYYMKTSEEDSDYLVDHSIIIYLMDPNMELVKFFGKNNDADALADGVIKEMKQYKSKKATS
uniref:MADS-box domain-containing protein n=1 Tax=Salix viminalis TaxID=40686 RepID=A0A6N2KLS0_SALVM